MLLATLALVGHRPEWLLGTLFLMGMHSSTGWWYYFLVVCLIKIPVAILIGGIEARREGVGVGTFRSRQGAAGEVFRQGHA